MKKLLVLFVTLIGLTSVVALKASLKTTIAAEKSEDGGTKGNGSV